MQMQELIFHVLCRQQRTPWQTCTCTLTGAMVGLLLVLVSDHLLAGFIAAFIGAASIRRQQRRHPGVNGKGAGSPILAQRGPKNSFLHCTGPRSAVYKLKRRWAVTCSRLGSRGWVGGGSKNPCGTPPSSLQRPPPPPSPPPPLLLQLLLPLLPQLSLKLLVPLQQNQPQVLLQQLQWTYQLQQHSTMTFRARTPT